VYGVWRKVCLACVACVVHLGLYLGPKGFGGVGAILETLPQIGQVHRGAKDNIHWLIEGVVRVVELDDLPYVTLHANDEDWDHMRVGTFEGHTAHTGFGREDVVWICAVVPSALRMDACSGEGLWG
jgi:hypothetical protein